MKEAKTVPLTRTERRNAARASAEAHDGRPLVSVDQAAIYLGVSRDTIYRLVRNGELRRSRISKTIKFRLSDLDDYVNRNVAS